MVAAAHPLAVGVGVDVLRRGGSAVDAAITTNTALVLTAAGAWLVLRHLGRHPVIAGGAPALAASLRLHQ